MTDSGPVSADSLSTAASGMAVSPGPPISAGEAPEAVVRRRRVDPGERGRLALAVAAAVDGVGGAHRSGGGGVEVATQYPGGRVVGVQLGSETVTVLVVAERFPLDELADTIGDAAHAVLAATGDTRTVNVVIDDLDVTALPGRRRGVE